MKAVRRYIVPGILGETLPIKHYTMHTTPSDKKENGALIMYVSLGVSIRPLTN
jgi:hypothetical protein